MCRHSSHKVWYAQFSYIGQYSHYDDPKTRKPLGEYTEEAAVNERFELMFTSLHVSLILALRLS